jgi:hypothetical protein
MGWASPGRDFSFTRGYMSSLTTPETPGTSITVIETGAFDRNTLKTTCITEQPGTVRPSPLHTSPSVDEQSVKSFVSFGAENPDDTGSINPFDTGTLRSSDSSKSRDGEKEGIVQEDFRSKSPHSFSHSSSSPPPFSPTMRSYMARSPSSRSSVQSAMSSVHSTSPISLRQRRSVQYDPGRQTSIVSLDSEMYFSAEEDALSSSDSNVPTFKHLSLPDKVSSEGEGLDKSQDETLLRQMDRGQDKTLMRHNININSSFDKDTTLTESPKSHMERSDVSQINVTVMERNETSSSASDMSYMSVDTDLDETMSGGIPEHLSMVDLHGQVLCQILLKKS